MNSGRSFVGNKSNQRWTWYAIEHSTNTILAYVFGKRKDVVFCFHHEGHEGHEVFSFLRDLCVLRGDYCFQYHLETLKRQNLFASHWQGR